MKDPQDGELPVEFARIERLAEIFRGTNSGVAVGIGDDAAIVKFAGAGAAVSVDAAQEGTHFRRAWIPLEDIGYRAHMAALSDLAAMGAAPRYSIVALALPASFSDAELDALALGIAAAGHETGSVVVGGNLARGTDLAITTTVLGDPPATPLRRGGARAGDRVWVTGPIGGAALGLAALEAGGAAAAHDEVLGPFVRRWSRPRARFDAATRMVGLATSAIDISDGLVQDAGHVARASGVDLVLRADAVPRDPGWAAATGALGLDGQVFGLGGGEDYELLFTAPAEADASAFAHPLGEVRPGKGRVQVLAPNSTPLEIGPPGHDHFRGQDPPR